MTEEGTLDSTNDDLMIIEPPIQFSDVTPALDENTLKERKRMTLRSGVPKEIFRRTFPAWKNLGKIRRTFPISFAIFVENSVNSGVIRENI